MDDVIDEALSDVDESVSPDLEWRTWHVDDPELESDEVADEEVKKKRKIIGMGREEGSDMSLNPFGAGAKVGWLGGRGGGGSFMNGVKDECPFLGQWTC